MTQLTQVAPPQPDAPDDQDDPAVSSTRSGWLTLGISSLGILAVFLDSTVLFVAFEDIGRSFPSVSAPTLAWVLNGYTITFAALVVPAGKIADRLGHRRAFLSGLAVFTVASALCAAAPSAGALVGFRVLQAVGAAMLLPSSLALVLRAFPREQIPVAVAVWGAMGALAAAIGPSLGSVLIEVGGWRWVFLINLPIGAATLYAGARVFVESRDPESRIPAPVGILLIASSAALVSLAVLEGEGWGWTSGRTVAAFGGGLVLLGVFVPHQRWVAAPALDLALFESHNYRWANAGTLAFGIAFTAMFFSSILFLTNVWDWEIWQAGLGVSPGPLLVAMLAPLMGRLAMRTGQRPLLMVGGVMFALGGLWRLAFLGEEADYLVDYLPSMLLTGIGVALIIPQQSSVVAQAIPPNRLGVGSGANQAIRQFGGTFGVALTITLIGVPESLAEAVSHFDRIWWLMIGGGLLSAVLASRLRTAPTQPAASPQPVAAAARR